MMRSIFIFMAIFIIIFGCQNDKDAKAYDVVVIGEGTGAIAAAIESARNGMNTLHITPIDWLGGMLTSAGVSATDGNHRLAGGIWKEFRDSLHSYYNTTDLASGWVSNTLFEPKIGEVIFDQIASKENNLTIIRNTSWSYIKRRDDGWIIQTKDNSNHTLKFKAKILIDGTELGDVAAAVGAKFDLGFDPESTLTKSITTTYQDPIIQDLTYAAILQKTDTPSIIPKPSGYNPEAFRCACSTYCIDTTVIDCGKMLEYARLPNDKFLINWPNNGNDYYTNVVDLGPKGRLLEYDKAKQKTLSFIYYLQTELGFSDLKISNEFDTNDELPLLPYHREGRRIQGLQRLDLAHILSPFEHDYYKYGIAVGDYPIDHHHKEKDFSIIDFPKIPSYNIPIGALIPKEIPNFIIADKAISVTNIVNGTTRLQPVVLQLGQAAGKIAAFSIITGKYPKDVDIRRIQDELLSAGCYIMPYIDCDPNHLAFEAVQKLGAMGILKGTGIPYKWANQTWIYPDSIIHNADIVIPQLAKILKIDPPKTLTKTIATDQLFKWANKDSTSELDTQLLSTYNITSLQAPLSKAQFAMVVTMLFDPFLTNKIEL